MTRYLVTHRTEYRYESPVSSSFGQLHLIPRDLPGQRCVKAALLIEPPPAELRERRDYFGNRASYFSVLHPHTTLTVTATSDVEVRARNAGGPVLADQPWEHVRSRLRSDHADGVLEAREYVLDSPLAAAAPALMDYALVSFTPGRPFIDATRHVCQRIHHDFTYRPGATTITTTLDDLLARREGVCQDFAHLAIGCLRSIGLAARYVSGYIETHAPPGLPKLEGADRSHAWLSVFAPDAGWIDIDPTNDQLVDDRYVTTAWGRDYADVPPVKGVIYTDCTEHDLAVSVDVVRVGDG